jgi:predicted DNA-binding transcriptional regulator AlpA
MLDVHDPLMSSAQVAEFLHIHPKTLLAWIRDDKFIEPIRAGQNGNLRFDRTAVEAWLRKNGGF